MELLRALAVLAEPPERAEAGRVAAALGLGAPPPAEEHAALFIFQLSPYASVYLGAEGMLGGEARARVAGFLEAVGLEPPAEADHLSLMLAAYARLAELDEEAGAGERADWGAARRAFLWEHLLSWLPVYLDKLSEVAPPFYRAWGALAGEALDAEARAHGPAPDALPLQLREAPPLAAPADADGEEFLRSLLAPARSGLVLTRADLAHAARTLGLGARAGGRLFTLKSMLGQDATAVLQWLASEAEAWASRHAARRGLHGPIAEWWESRAGTTAGLLKRV